MKTIKLFLFALLICGATTAQNVSINADGSTPDASAMLDVKSTTKGLLTPRMTATQRAAISSAATGLLVYQTDGSAGYYYYDGNSWLQISSSATTTTPAGVIQQYAATTAPIGYLICDGTAVSRTTYAALFQVISTTYGSGDGSTTFNLPDFRGRVAVAKSTDTEFDVMGEKGGAKTHTLTTAELASHSHNVDPASVSSSSEGSHTHAIDPPSTTSSSDGNHTHTYVDEHELDRDWIDYPNETLVSDNQTAETKTTSAAGIHSHTVNIASFTSGAGSSHSHTIDVANTTSTSTGSGSAHNNLQPYIVVNYIIKY